MVRGERRSRVRRLSAGFDRGLVGVYERLGARYVYVTWAAAFGLMLPAFLAVAYFLALPHLPEEDLTLLAPLLGATALYATAGIAWLRIGRPSARMMARWWAHDRPPEEALPVWAVLSTLSRRITTTLLVVGGPVALPMVVLISVDLGIGVDGTLAMVAAALLLGILGGTGSYFLVEVALRPAVLDATARIPRDFRPPGLAFPFGARVFGSLLGIGVFASGLGVVLGSGGKPIDELIGPMLAVTAVAAVFVSGLTLVIVRSLITPIDDLIEATHKVAGGDLDAVAPVSSDDELGALASSFNLMVADLQRNAAELRASRARIVASGNDARRRVERDLHDGAQQSLMLVNLKLGLIEKRLATDPDAAAGLIAGARNDLDRALDELRDLAHGIYPQVLTSDGLHAALTEAAGEATVQAEVELEESVRYPAELEAAVYFCCLEALQNVGKHAGEAATAVIRLTERNGQLRFEVADTGSGFDPGAVNGSTGLQNIADRIGALGGSVRIESEPGAGTTVAGAVPLTR